MSTVSPPALGVDTSLKGSDDQGGVQCGMRSALTDHPKSCMSPWGPEGRALLSGPWLIVCVGPAGQARHQSRHMADGRKQARDSVGQPASWPCRWGDFSPERLSARPPGSRTGGEGCAGRRGSRGFRGKGVRVAMQDARMLPAW